MSNTPKVVTSKCVQLPTMVLLSTLGTENIATLTPSKFVTSAPAIKRFTPRERGCYLDEEFELTILKWSSGYRYSIKNCLYESVIDR